MKQLILQLSAVLLISSSCSVTPTINQGLEILKDNGLTKPVYEFNCKDLAKAYYHLRLNKISIAMLNTQRLRNCGLYK